MNTKPGHLANWKAVDSSHELCHEIVKHIPHSKHRGNIKVICFVALFGGIGTPLINVIILPCGLLRPHYYAFKSSTWDDYHISSIIVY